MSIFSYSLLLKMLKFRRSSLRLVFPIKIVYNQVLLLKKFRLRDWIWSFIWFVPTNLIWNPIYLIISQAIKSQLKWGQLKFYEVWNEKGSVKKRKTSNNRSRVFEIGRIEGMEKWREWKFFLGELQSFNAEGNIQ